MLIIRSYSQTEPFTTKDGSTIRSLLDLSNAPVRNQSLAEAEIPPGCSTMAHYHAESEEFYYVIQGSGLMRIEAEENLIQPGDSVLIPPGKVHQLTNNGQNSLRILCCCAPPYRHEDTILES